MESIKVVQTLILSWQIFKNDTWKRYSKSLEIWDINHACAYAKAMNILNVTDKTILYKKAHLTQYWENTN